MCAAYTPLFKALSEYQYHDYARFHMPGHKGTGLPIFGEIAAFDVTELEGTDSLFEANGPIAELEKLFTALYESNRTVLSAGGSTLCIQAMLRLVAQNKNNGKIIAGRNIHVAAVNAMALLGLEPIWAYPNQKNALIGKIEPEEIEKIFLDNINNNNICAVYITSPDYFGVMSDIREIAKICKKYKTPLLVDNAHGAHLKFIPNNINNKSLHPIDFGADLCCDSLHKTLPALTGAALLHSGNDLYSNSLKPAMSLFGSTSPNYLIMLSCDQTAEFLQADAKEKIFNTTKRCDKIKKLAAQKGFILPENCDPMRITLPLSGTGISKNEFHHLLRKYKLMEELLNNSACVLLASPFNREEDFCRLENLLQNIKITPEEILAYPIIKPEQVLSLREAIFAPKENISVENINNRIAAEVKITCPPGIPLIMPGEKLCKDYIKLLKTVGILNIDVLK